MRGLERTRPPNEVMMAYQEASSYSQAKPTGAKPAPAATKPAGPPGSKRPKEGTGGRRYVRTQAGAARYKKPIGAEIIAEPRDERGKRAQGDKESTDRYKSLVSADRDAQEKAMRGLNEDQLKRLSEVAFSFRSSDPEVARLRAGVSLEMKRRGLDVNRYGGLSGRGRSGSGQSGGSSSDGESVEVINWATGERYRVQTKEGKKAAAKRDREAEADERRAHGEAERQERMRRSERDRQARKIEADARKAENERKRVAAAAERERIRKENAANRLAVARTRNEAKYRKRTPVILPMSNSDEFEVIELAAIAAPVRQKAAEQGKALPGGRFPIRNVADLRNAIQAFGRAKPEDRQRIARFICKRAQELNAKHMVGAGIRKAAGYDHRSDTDLAAVGEFGVVELEGRWKHGWIPLDAAAVRAKTKGRDGAKPWWETGTGETGHGGGKPGRKKFNYETGKFEPRSRARQKVNYEQVSSDRTTVVKSGMTSNDATPAFRKRYGHLSDDELQAAKLDARKRAQTDASAQNELHMITREQDRRESAGRDVAKAPAVAKSEPKLSELARGLTVEQQRSFNALSPEGREAYRKARAAGKDHSAAMFIARNPGAMKAAQTPTSSRQERSAQRIERGVKSRAVKRR